jgi:hypothetical protein
MAFCRVNAYKNLPNRNRHHRQASNPSPRLPPLPHNQQLRPLPRKTIDSRPQTKYRRPRATDAASLGASCSEFLRTVCCGRIGCAYGDAVQLGVMPSLSSFWLASSCFSVFFSTRRSPLVCRQSSPGRVDGAARHTLRPSTGGCARVGFVWAFVRAPIWIRHPRLSPGALHANRWGVDRSCEPVCPHSPQRR